MWTALLVTAVLGLAAEPLCLPGGEPAGAADLVLEASRDFPGQQVRSPIGVVGWRLFSVGSDGGAQPDWRCEQCVGIPSCICGAECGRSAYFCDCLAAPPDYICRLDQCMATLPSLC